MGPHEETRTTAPARSGANTVLSRINAVFFALMDGYMHWKLAARKTALFDSLPDTIVELGAGAGANFRYFRRGTKVIAVEPNVYMHAPLRRVAKKHGIELEILATSAASIDLPTASVDAVVTSLVLCSVGDQDAVLREVQRILRPGGEFRCIEHVAAPETTFVGRAQRLVFRPWRWFFEGCHTHLDTAATLAGAGFTRVEVEQFTIRSIFVPVRPQIAATCTR